MALNQIFCVALLQVSITSDEKRAVNSKVIRRKIVDKLHETYSSEFAGKKFAYDGEKNLYTVGPLPRNRLEFTVVVEESSARQYVLEEFLDCVVAVTSRLL